MARFLSIALTVLYPAGLFADEGLDRIGDPLPSGAVLRLGTNRFAVDAAHYLSFSRNSNRLLAWYRGATRLFDAATGKTIRDFPSSYSAALSPDGNTVALYEHDPKTKKEMYLVFDANTGRQKRRLPSRFGNAVFSPDGRTLVVVPFWGAPVAWELATGKQSWSSTSRLLGPARYNAHLRRVAFSLDGKRLIGTDYYDLCIWNATNGKLIHRGKRGGLKKYWVSPDGKLAAKVLYNTLKVLTVPNMKQVRQWRDAETWPNGKYVRGEAVAFSHNNAHIAWRSRGAITLAEVKTGKIRHVLKTTRFPYTLLFSPDGRRLASADGQGMIRLWDVATGKSLNAAQSHHAAIHNMTTGRDGRTIVTAGYDNTIRIWDGVSGRQQNVLVGPADKLALSPNGKLVAATSYIGGKVDIWNLRSGKRVREFAHGEDAVVFPAFGPKHRLYAFFFTYGDSQLNRSSTYQLIGWNLTNSKSLKLPVRTKKASDSGSQLVAFSPVGSLLAYVDSTGSLVHLLDCASSKELTSFRFPAGGNKSFVAVGFAPDSQTLATLTTDDEIHLWDIRSQSKIQSLPGGELSFSPDGRYLIVATEVNDPRGKADCRIRLWEWRSNRVVWKRDLPDRTLHNIAVVAGGKSFVALEQFTPDLPYALVWTLAPKQLPKLPIEKHWQRLAGGDAKAAYASMWAMTQTPDVTLSHLQRHLKPETDLSEAHFAHLLADLNSPRFAVREKATHRLRSLGSKIAEGLRHAIQHKKLTLEVHLRIQRLLAELRKQMPAADELRAMRALTVLEWIGNSRAKQLLATLAAGSQHARFTVRAQSAVRRANVEQ